MESGKRCMEHRGRRPDQHELCRDCQVPLRVGQREGRVGGECATEPGEASGACLTGLGRGIVDFWASENLSAVAQEEPSGSCA